jgi:hypothetical protein
MALVIGAGSAMAEECPDTLTPPDDTGKDVQWMVPEGEPAANQWLAYRQSFVLSEVPAQAVAGIACDSKYWLWINGELVIREGQLKRGPTPTSTYMDQVDLAPYVKPGTNTIALLHWYFGRHGYSHNSSGSPGLFFDLPFAGSENWKMARHPSFGKVDPPEPNYRLPEASVRFDAGQDLKGWTLPGYDDSDWGSPVLAGPRGCAPWGELVVRPVPQWKDWGVNEYVETTKSREDGYTIYTCRLPYNAHVHPILEVEAPAGKRIEFETDSSRRTGKPCVRGGYVTREGLQSYEHLPWLNGHEVVYRIPKGVRVVSLKYRETGYDAELIGAWKSDDPVLDELWQRSYRTLYVNMRDTYMDCPDRERAQWWGDVVVQLAQNVYLFDYESGQELLRKVILELARWQREDDSIYAPVPSGIPAAEWNSVETHDGSYGRELPYQMLSSVGWYGFQRYYLFTGDRETIEQVYPHVRDYLALWELTEQGVTKPREPLGAWIWVDWGKHQDTPVLAGCWHYLALKAAVEMARVAGAEDDIPQYLEIMKSIEDHFHTVYWQGDRYRSEKHKGETDDRANGMAVVAGLAPESVYPEMRTVLEKEMHASPYMEKYVLESLFMMGYPEAALKRMKHRYDVMLDLPYTTLREHFHPEQGSDNHAWSGGPLTLMEEYIAGIYPTSPGYATYRIRPMLGTVRELDTTVATARGPLRVAMDRKGTRFRLQLAPPADCIGEVHVPNPRGVKFRQIAVNGKPVWERGKGVTHPDVQWAGHRDGYEVLSGVQGEISIVAR